MMTDKEKAYDDALAVAKMIHRVSDDPTEIKRMEQIFPELKESEDEKIRKAIHIYLDWLDGRNKDYQPKGEYTIRDMLTWLEKQGKKEPAEGAGPKFNNGQWIVWHGKCYKVNGCRYELIDQNGRGASLGYSTVNESAHLWTIADAIDGDVLTDKGCPFIFKCTKPSDIKTEIKNPLAVLGYCGIGGAGFTKSGGWGDTANCIYYPATKEQRDKLMKAMADAGYEFDFDKKELKKIEQKPAEDIDAEKASEEYRNYRMSCGITDPVMLDEIESAYYEGAIQPTSWSEEDKDILSRIITHIEALEDFAIMEKDAKTLRKEANWLKSLRPSHWKPSETELCALYGILLCAEDSPNKKIVTKLFNKLKY